MKSKWNACLLLSIFLIVCNVVEAQEQKLEERLTSAWSLDFKGIRSAGYEKIRWPAGGVIHIDLSFDEQLDKLCKTSLSSQLENAARDASKDRGFQFKLASCQNNECIAVDLTERHVALRGFSDRLRSRPVTATSLSAVDALPIVRQFSMRVPAQAQIDSVYVGLPIASFRDRAMRQGVWKTGQSCPEIDFGYYLKFVSVVGANEIGTDLLWPPPFNHEDEHRLTLALFDRFYPSVAR